VTSLEANVVPTVRVFRRLGVPTQTEVGYER
jgi:hypothetical protein